MQSKQFYSIRDWNLTADSQWSADSRVEVSFIIGDIIDTQTKEIVDYIIEDIYSDVYLGALNKIYQFKTYHELIPPVLFLYQGEVIPHNEKHDTYLADIYKTVSENIPIAVLIKSIVDSRIQRLTPGAIDRRNDGLTALCNLVKLYGGVNYQPDIVETVAKQYIRGLDDTWSTDLRKRFATSSNIELVRLIGAIKEYRALGEEFDSASEELQMYLNSFDISRVEQELNAAIADKLFFGET